MNNYAAGWNMGGYSPEPDNVFVTDNWDYAVHYLSETIDRWWDQDYDSIDDEPNSDVDGRYADVHTELHNSPIGPEWHGSVANSSGYDYHLWIVPTDQPVEQWV